MNTATTYTKEELNYLTVLLGRYIEAIAKQGVTIKELSALHFKMATGEQTTFDANDTSFLALLIAEIQGDPRLNEFSDNLYLKLKKAAA